MRRLGFAGLSFLAAVCSFDQMAGAYETQGFTKPSYEGHLFDWCYSWGTDCGDRAADAWCRVVKGFDSSLSSANKKLENPGRSTRTIGTGQVCDEAECDGFASITCVKEIVVNQTFQKPMFKTGRLDWCLTWGSNCGKPVADAFCKAQGFSEETNFVIDENIGLTRIMGDGKECDDPDCDGFKYIICK